MRGERTAVLMYHRVMPEETAAFGAPSCYRLRGTAVTPPELAAHLDWFTAQQIPVVRLADVVAACVRRQQPPPGVVLTFDDGYAEWLTEVAPRLSARRMTASFFVSTNVHAEATRAHPVDEYYFLLDHARVPELGITLPDGQKVAADLRVFADKRALVFGPLKQCIVRGTAAEQSQLLSTLRKLLAVPTGLLAELPAALYLSRTAWRRLTEAGSNVEAHGHSHRRLTELTESEIDWELEICLASLRAYVGDSHFFAYPDGACDDRVAARVAAAGLIGALTVAPGDVTAGSNRFRLPRYFVRSGAQLGEILG